MKSFALIAFATGFIVACSSQKKSTPLAIGFVTLHNYVLNPGISFPGVVNYTFIAGSGEFQKMFSMTKSSPGSVTVPDFTSRSVVAIVLEPTEKVVSIDINKAEIAGNDLNIYYTITDTTSWKTYLQTPMVMATVPRSTIVQHVNFYSRKGKEKTIVATY